MSDLKPTVKQIELYKELRRIAKPHHMYADQIMAIAEYIDGEYIHKSKANGVNMNERLLTMPDIVWQSELLLAYLKYQNSPDYKPETRMDKEVEKFLSQQ